MLHTPESLLRVMSRGTITIDGDSKVDSVTVSSQGQDYTFGSVNFVGGGVPVGTTRPEFDVIMTPQVDMVQISTENWVHIMS